MKKAAQAAFFKVIGNSEEVIGMVSALRRTIKMVRAANTTLIHSSLLLLTFEKALARLFKVVDAMVCHFHALF